MAAGYDQYNQTGVMTPRADLTARDAADLTRLTEVSGLADATDLVVDCANVRYLDSQGLEALVIAARRCADRHGRLKLASLAPHCRKILKITRLDHRFECFADVPTALRSAA